MSENNDYFDYVDGYIDRLKQGSPTTEAEDEELIEVLIGEHEWLLNPYPYDCGYSRDGLRELLRIVIGRVRYEERMKELSRLEEAEGELEG